MDRCELPWNAKHGRVSAVKDSFYDSVMSKREFEGTHPDKTYLISKAKDWVISADEKEAPSLANMLYTVVLKTYGSLEQAAGMQKADQSTLDDDERVTPVPRNPRGLCISGGKQCIG